MENKLPLERNEKLKIYATVSIRKDVDHEKIRKDDSMFLSLSTAYNDNEVIQGVAQGLKAHGKNPNEFIVKFMGTRVEAEKVVDMPNSPPGVALAPGLDRKLIYLEDIFNEFGTPAQIKVAEKVIQKAKSRASE